MAKIYHEHMLAKAGLSGEFWNISEGYNQSFSTTGGLTDDVDFDPSTRQISLVGGDTFPSWFISGKQFSVSGSTSNDGVYTVEQVVSTTVIKVKQTSLVNQTDNNIVITFNGSINTGVQDVLLNSDDGILTELAPLAWLSTGALGANRTLNISALELESSPRGTKSTNGRIIYLSVQNSDILTNSLTLIPGNSINGNPDFTITTEGDYWLIHMQNGDWQINVLPRPGENIATIARVPFVASDWSDPPNFEIKVLQTGTPSNPSEIGPHNLTLSSTYLVQVYNTEDGTINEIEDVEVQIEKATGNILLYKAGIGNAFDGIVIISGSLD